MEAKVNRGYLEYADEKGSYRIPLGRRTRKCLTVLDRKEGEYVRSLELDLFTGFVYYCVDNATSGGLSYYYDMSSKKVGHYFIHRYLRTAASHGYTCTPLEKEIFEKLPCEDWMQELEKLPGWKEAIDNRLQNLFLPGREVLRIPCSGLSGTGEDSAQAPEAEDLRNVSSVTFYQTPADYPNLRREFVFLLEKAGDRVLLRHRAETFGGEFFGENEEYDRFLTKEEYAWILSLLGTVREGGTAQGSAGSQAGQAAGGPDAAACREGLLELLPHRETLVMEEVCAGGTGGELFRVKTNTAGQKTTAELLKAALRGLLRREIELV